MKYLLLIALSILQGVPDFAQHKNSIIAISTEGPESEQPHFNLSILTTDIGNIEKYISPEISESDKTIHFKIELARPTYLKLNKLLLYLKPNDSLFIRLTKNKSTPTFSGTVALENSYLQTLPSAKHGSFLPIRLLNQDNFQINLPVISSRYENFRKSLAELPTKDTYFRNHEQIRLKSHLISSYIHLVSTFTSNTASSIGRIEAIVDSLEAFVKPVFSTIECRNIKTQYLDMFEFRYVIEKIVKHNRRTKECVSKEVEEWVRDNDLYNAVLSNDKIFDESDIQAIIENIKDKGHQHAILAAWNTERKIYTYIDSVVIKNIEEEDIFIRALKGKFLYIDFWATWCAPCIENLKKIDYVRTRYKNDEIVFITIKVDGGLNEWKNSLKRLTKDDYFLLSPDLESLGIFALPRSILLDKSGKIIDSKAPHLADPKLLNEIDVFLDISSKSFNC